MKKIITPPLYKSILVLFILLTSVVWSYAQNTVVNGIVTDAKTKAPLPFVTVVFAGSTDGISTDNQGKFHITTSESYSQVKISFVGYKTAIRAIEPGKVQTVNVALTEENQQLSEVVIKSGKKARYRNKNNPAVELIRQVIAHKDKNRLENYDYAEYRQYELMNFT